MIPVAIGNVIRGGSLGKTSWQITQTLLHIRKALVADLFGVGWNVLRTTQGALLYLQADLVAIRASLRTLEVDTVFAATNKSCGDCIAEELLLLLDPSFGLCLLSRGGAIFKWLTESRAGWHQLTSVTSSLAFPALRWNLQRVDVWDAQRPLSRQVGDFSTFWAISSTRFGQSAACTPT
jgi:hypothetical protein